MQTPICRPVRICMLALALLATTLAGAGFAAGKDGPSIKVGAAFLDQMVQATLIGAHLVFDDVTLTDAQKPAVYGALQTAAQIAQKKIIAPLFAEADERRVAMEVGGSQIIKALDKKEIESCVAGFVREMPAAISREDRMALEVWARKHLRRVFAEDYVLTLLRASPYGARPGTVVKEETDPMMDFFFSLERARVNDADSPKPADGDIGGGWTYKFTIMDRASALRGAAAPRQTTKPAADDGKLEKKRPYPRSAFDFIESLNLDAKASNLIYPTYAKVQELARRKQLGPLVKSAEKAAIKVGQTLTIEKLGSTEIDECVTMFLARLPAAISESGRKTLAGWARSRLRHDYGETYTITLEKDHHEILPDGSIIGHAPQSTSSMRHAPSHLRDYWFNITRTVNGAVKPGSETAGPEDLMQGRQFELLYIDDPDNPAASSVTPPPFPAR